MLVTKQLVGLMVFSHTMEANGAHLLFGYPHSHSKNIFLNIFSSNCLGVCELKLKASTQTDF